MMMFSVVLGLAAAAAAVPTNFPKEAIHPEEAKFIPIYKPIYNPYEMDLYDNIYDKMTPYSGYSKGSYLPYKPYYYKKQFPYGYRQNYFMKYMDYDNSDKYVKNYFSTYHPDMEYKHYDQEYFGQEIKAMYNYYKWLHSEYPYEFSKEYFQDKPYDWEEYKYFSRYGPQATHSRYFPKDYDFEYTRPHVTPEFMNKYFKYFNDYETKKTMFEDHPYMYNGLRSKRETVTPTTNEGAVDTQGKIVTPKDINVEEKKRDARDIYFANPLYRTVGDVLPYSYYPYSYRTVYSPYHNNLPWWYGNYGNYYYY